MGVSLRSDEIQTFKKQGYIGPYPMMSPDEMQLLTPQVEDVLESDPVVNKGSDNTPLGNTPRKYNRLHNRHLDQPVIYNLATHPSIISKMVLLYGRTSSSGALTSSSSILDRNVFRGVKTSTTGRLNRLRSDITPSVGS